MRWHDSSKTGEDMVQRQNITGPIHLHIFVLTNDTDAQVSKY